jgi:L-ascorbate metabolism protein UlaG (beta-lactamase superfamily)
VTRVGALYDLVFPRFRAPRGGARIDERAARITWLGTAAHVVSTAKTTVLVDPYVSRHRLRQVATRRLEPDEGAIARWIPEKVDAILCGHSHYDHLLDAPRIAKKTGAKLVGSATTCAFARAEGVPEEKLVLVPPEGARLAIGDVDVRFVPSKHGRVALGRVPFPGEVRSPPRLPARASAYKMGGAFGIVMNAAGVRIYHNGSADLIDTELEGERADVLLVGLAGRKATPRYLPRLLAALEPSLVIPTHHDAFFAPLEAGVHLLPGIDLEGFASEVRAHAPRARVAIAGYGEPLG